MVETQLLSVVTFKGIRAIRWGIIAGFLLAVIGGLALGYRIGSRSGHWMLISSGSMGGTQTVGVFHSRDRCLWFLNKYIGLIKAQTVGVELKPNDEKEKEILGRLQSQGIFLFQLNGSMGWATVSCVRLGQSLLPEALTDIEAKIDDLESRIDNVELR